MTLTTPFLERLSAAGVDLGPPLIPNGQYAPWILDGHHLYISGQVSIMDDCKVLGTIGRDLSLDEGYEAARLCGINLLRQMSSALNGELGRVRQILRITGFVQAEDGFTQIPQVMNGCSDLLLQIFSDQGRHTRSSVGAKQLPRNCAVEVDAVVAISPD